MRSAIVVFFSVVLVQAPMAPHGLKILASESDAWSYSPGDAFMIIETPTRTGIKEEMSGFNTREGLSEPSCTRHTADYYAAVATKRFVHNCTVPHLYITQKPRRFVSGVEEIFFYVSSHNCLSIAT